MLKTKLLPFLLLLFASVGFFYSFFFLGKLPIPSDTIVGLYYPFRDLYSKDYPRGIPYKNFMITDPVRQQYPWKNLAIDIEKRFELPLWNPYTFAGQPLMGNLQSGALYPLNLVFFVFSFPLAWGFYIFLQPLLASIFVFIYLRNLELDKKAGILGALSFSFGGLFISWLEWGTILHTALWLPLILLTIDKIITINDSKLFNKWSFLLSVSLIFSFLAGHLQLFFYMSLFSLFYTLFRIYKVKSKRNSILSFTLSGAVFLIVTSPIWYEALRFISLSGRSLDQDWHTISGWFVPWQNLIQVLIPDFFGNPATLNYSGVWNYGEFVSYIGVGSFIFVLFAAFRKEKITWFFFLSLLLAIIFAFPTLIAKIPFKLEIPFISTSQPTRLVFLIDFCLTILAALGFDYFLKTKKKKEILYILASTFLLFIAFWYFVLSGLKANPTENLLVSKSNLILPTVLFALNAIILLIMVFIKNKKMLELLSIFILVVLFLDLYRFGAKYTPFVKEDYLFPKTKTIEFLEKNLGNYRFMSTDSRIFPPNFSVMYKLQTIDGYDPLYLKRYGEFSAALERGSADIHSPFGFNRIITPQNYHSRVVDLLGVKYVLSLSQINNKNFVKVLQEGETIVYRNKNVLPRAFFVNFLFTAKNKQEAIDFIYQNQRDLESMAVLEEDFNKKVDNKFSRADIINYSENRVTIKTQNPDDGFLILTDNFYPTWSAKVDGKKTKIYLTDFTFRGIFVPKGSHTVEFINSL